MFCHGSCETVWTYLLVPTLLILIISADFWPFAFRFHAVLFDKSFKSNQSYGGTKFTWFIPLFFIKFTQYWYGRNLNHKDNPNNPTPLRTLPVPRDSTPAPKYMSWLEVMSSNLPPILMLRGNQQDALTFYC
jgi:hypothetical protein